MAVVRKSAFARRLALQAKPDEARLPNVHCLVDSPLHFAQAIGRILASSARARVEHVHAAAHPGRAVRQSNAVFRGMERRGDGAMVSLTPLQPSKDDRRDEED